MVFKKMSTQRCFFSLLVLEVMRHFTISNDYIIPKVLTQQNGLPAPFIHCHLTTTITKMQAKVSKLLSMGKA